MVSRGFRLGLFFFFNMGIYMVEIGEADCVYEADVGEYMTSLSFFFRELQPTRLLVLLPTADGPVHSPIR